MTQELTRQYNNRGKYNVADHARRSSGWTATASTSTINVKEGKAAKIRHINLIGNETFAEEDITEGWESHTSNWMSWYKRDDQYSREKLSGDLEKLNSYYLDRGYVDFSVDSTQVAISADRKDMFITAGITEGEVYKVADDQASSGDTVLPKAEVETIVSFIKPGETSRAACWKWPPTRSPRRLSNIGYAFAQVNPMPNIDRDKRTVGVNFQVEPGPRVNVRRIVFKGNTRTADEVLRREMRQFEGSWYSQAAIDRSQGPPAAPRLLRDGRASTASRWPAPTTRSTSSTRSRKPPPAAFGSASAIRSCPA